LDVLVIKSEVDTFSSSEPNRGIKAHFMNLEISLSESESGVYETCKFDKCRALLFVYTQYIKFKSNRLVKQSYSIAISQTIPILYLSSSIQAAERRSTFSLTLGEKWIS